VELAEGLQSPSAKRVRQFTAPAAVRKNALETAHRDGGPRRGGLKPSKKPLNLSPPPVGTDRGKGDHTKPAEVKRLVAVIKRQHKGLDILVNDVWGGDPLTEFGKTFWTVNLDNGLRMLKQAVHSRTQRFHGVRIAQVHRPGGGSACGRSKVKKRSGRVFSSWALAREYGFTDLDGSQPHWGNYARKKYGKYKICDERFFSYWVPGLVELIFPDWF